MKTTLHSTKHLQRRSLLAAVFAGLLALAAPAVLHAQAVFNGTTAYTQDFDSLTANAVSEDYKQFSFTNNATLPGWYSNVGGSNTGRATSGVQRGSGTIYSWGDAGSSDRALGIFTGQTGGFSSDTAYLGLQLQNISGDTINAVQLTFTIEQWRKSTNASTWDFSWLATNTTGNQLAASGYTTDTRANAVTTNTTSPTGALLGNDPANKTTISVTLSNLNWGANEYLWLRWANTQPTAAAAGLGLDNLSVELATVPEPAATALLLGLPVLLVAFRIRRR